MKQALSLALEALKTHPLAFTFAFFALAVMPGIVKLASFLPKG